MLAETMTLPPTDGEQIRELNRLLQLGSPALVGSDNEQIELPEGVYQILKDVVRNMSAGRAVALVSQQQQMTTQSAANFLGFSRPHLVKLLEAGTIPFEKVGQHRRVRLEDVLAFQKNRDAVRRNALNELARSEFESGHYEYLAIPEDGSDV